MDDGEPDIEEVTSVGDLDPVVVTLRDFLHHTGATRVAAVLPGPALVDVGQFLPVEVTLEDQTLQLPHGQALDAAPLALPAQVELKQLPPYDVKPLLGEVHGTIGGLELHATAVRGLAHALGPSVVAMASFPTTTPDLPLSISARGEDPIVIAIGDEDYEMEAGWP